MSKINFIKIFIFSLIILCTGTGMGYLVRIKHESLIQKNQEKKNVYLLFVDEVYDTIQQNYWQKVSDEDLSDLFNKAINKVSAQENTLQSQDKEGVKQLFLSLSQSMDDQQKKDLLTNTADVVLANLSPFGRSRLYTQKNQEDLKNNVSNIDPTTDLYNELGVEKNASAESVKTAYTQLEKEWNPAASTASNAAEKYAKINRAYQVLSDADYRQLYDNTGIEPTIESRLYGDKILYLRQSKFSPTTMEELAKVTTKYDQGSLDTLILDLRDNIGGAIDNLPYMLAPFIGNDQYAFDYLHQNEKESIKSKGEGMPSLFRYKKFVILVNENTQSSAEVMASVLKKYNVGVLFGRTSRGWGTVERVFSLKTQLNPNKVYSIFLVHRLTLREDGQPIEGSGVEPVISIDDQTWPEQLISYYNFPKLVDAIKDIYK